jgi:hypothetical protein
MEQTAPWHYGFDPYRLTNEEFQSLRRNVLRDTNSLNLGGVGFMGTDTVSTVKSPTESEPASPADCLTFQHVQLSRRSDEIRLLTLNCTETGQLTATIRNFAFSSAPGYEALSYTWGSPMIRKRIYLNGQLFQINENLFQALTHLRSCTRGDSVTLWIDAVCINQEDASERNHQVNKMRLIYQRATRVRIWLGLGNSLSSSAFALARDLAKAVEVHREYESFNDPRRVSQFSAFQVLLHKEYWERVWVIQEVNAAKEAEVMCGIETISWKDLLTAQNAIVGNRDACWNLVMGNPQMDTFATDVFYEGPRSLMIPEGDGLPTLFEALRWYCTKESTQPEDRIYGLLGVTTAGNDEQFILDYSRGARQIYIDAAVYIIQSTGLLDIICLMQPHPDSRLPSWVPDWVNGNPTWPLNDWTDSFTASAETNAVVSFTQNGSVISAQGLFITKITQTGSVLSLSNNEPDADDGISKLVKKFHEWRMLIPYHGPMNQGTLLETFCQTFLSGGIREKLEPFLPRHPYAWTAETMLGLFAQLSTRYIPQSEIGSQLLALAFSANSLAPVDQLEAWARVILLGLRGVLDGRRFVITSNDTLGMVSQLAEVGDCLCVLLGCSVPVVLRPVRGGYKFLGNAYLENYMFGEFIPAFEKSGKPWQRFRIV